MSMSPAFEQGQYIKPSINVGCGFDILNGTYYRGRNGENILSGGLSYIMGFAGKGNQFKSTMMVWMFLTAMARMKGSAGNMYDTEMNIHEERVIAIMMNILDLNGEDLIELGRLNLTDKSVYSGNKWFEVFKTWMVDKKKDKKNLVETPFLDRDGVNFFKMLIPTFTMIDSFSQFDTDDVEATRDKNELGESGANMIHMRAGLVKTNFLMEVPRVTVSANNYMLMVAQIGKNTDIGAAQHAPPRYQLKHMPSGDALRGVTPQFTYATHDLWLCDNTALLIEKDSKEPLYPRHVDDNLRMDTDLMLVKMKQLRSKGGLSGITHEVVVSQSDGVQPALTEFHYLRERKLWGFEGSNQRYSLALYPSVTLTRPTVRSKLDADPMLRRAMTITVEIKQMDDHWGHLDGKGILCTPKELYDDLKAKGYDWDVLLNTRGWWTIGEHPLPYLSTMDLLEMRLGNYHPYWYDKLVGPDAAAKIIDKAPPYVQKKAA